MTVASEQLAFVFPGQGSQSIGMLRSLSEVRPEVESTFAEASQVLGLDLWRLVIEGPAEELNRTENTQPAMLAAGVAVWRIWQAGSDARPAWMAGHSLGEYTALVCGGRIAFADAVQLVRMRGKLMQEAVPEGVGAMAALLGLTDEQVGHLCRELSTPDALVAAANFNAPGQVVIAGHAAAVATAVEQAKQAGAKRAMMLPVSVPSHCALMSDAAGKLRALLSSVSIAPSVVRVVHNVDVGEHPDADDLRDVLAAQLHESVRWTETVRHLVGQGVTHIVECGPGKVLAGLNKRIVPDCRSVPIHDLESFAVARELMA